MQKQSTLNNIVILTMSAMTVQAIAFAFRIILAQMIGAEVMGLYQLIMPVFSMLLSLTCVGLTAAVSYLSAQFDATGNFRAIALLRNQSLRFFFALSVIPCAILLMCSDPVSVYVLGDARTQLGMILLVPCLLLTGVENLQKNYFYGIGQVKPAVFTELTEHILRAAIILGILVVALPCSAERAVGAIILGMVLGEGYSAFMQCMAFRHYLPLKKRRQGSGISSAHLNKKIKNIALPVGATALLTTVIGATNSVLIPRLLVQSGMDLSEAMSAYGVMFGMTIPLLFLPTAFISALNVLLAPKLSQSLALGKHEEICRRVKKAVAVANVILIPSVSLIAVIGPRVGAILYKDSRVGEHMDLLAIAVLLSCFQALMGHCLNGINKQKFTAQVAIWTDSLQLLITCLTVGHEKIGLSGFVWAYLISSGIGAYINWRKLSKETGLILPVFDWFFAPLLGSCLAASCTELLHTVFLQEGIDLLLSAGLCIICGVLIYHFALQAQGVSVWKLIKEERLR